jgi:hypothetical protein
MSKLQTALSQQSDNEFINYFKIQHQHINHACSWESITVHWIWKQHENYFDTYVHTYILTRALTEMFDFRTQF